MMTNHSNDDPIQGDNVKSPKLLFVCFIVMFFILVLPLLGLTSFSIKLSGFIDFENLVPFCVVLCIVMGLLASLLKSDFKKV